MMKRQGRWIAVLSLTLFAMCGAAASWGGPMLSSAAATVAKADQKQVPSISERVSMLWVLAELSGERKFNTTITVQGSFHTAEENWGKERNEWSLVIKHKEPLAEVTEHGRTVYRSHYGASSWKGDVLLFREKDGRAYYVVTIKGAANGGMKQSVEEADRLRSLLTGGHYENDWNATVQTETSLRRDAAWAKAEQAIKEWGSANPLDIYEDDRTISASYETSYMGEGVAMKDGHANLQVAVQENGSTGITRISFGTPLISGEY
ncbi:YwmB family TATA-box binding protein [Paenibacillus sp. ACRRX]|uniref:YwmB family TATA-box binding protein n=1 Tax=Paenibacillus sp. ACRRX TaxID=2918206 RepID=UPI001EF65DF5|nr:YwmB family TATA-box binding protein [Paenibacillus sp. ACRRX]MCG7410396.1 YwmB family TATA-box binding protein [Paenibacillus sp. ACRRX]